MRHLKAEIARNNRFPGLGKLYAFWRWSARYYADRNTPGLNEWGTPSTRTTLAEYLAPYAEKLVICRSPRDVDNFIRVLEIGSIPLRVDENA